MENTTPQLTLQEARDRLAENRDPELVQRIKEIVETKVGDPLFVMNWMPFGLSDADEHSPAPVQSAEDASEVKPISDKT